ncbi:hypothetical protein GLOIN_2v1782187 [Rhizophagus irregularis DAOM 181602=DAOM 197198]|uniref:Uncharacterized protein n=1 Tax=Rhizophagus irregularis (strain DAOM 197198w) TaxID=1432141 RepID=A0A015JQ64_RHIIW|nr:hypothetical protein RirG_209830 [Rhizophagus irregularis DAOM 197198w]GET62853.1 hypothetical protein GLOIN_2v1782187 [Rhizophagus irregularis DAOM 181602=DAOM 197198]
MLPIFPKVLPIVLPIFQEHITDLNEEEVDSIAVFSQKISVKEVIYSTIPIEYPMTSEAGVATVFNVTGWTNQRDCWNNF